MREIKKILVPMDFSGPSKKALSYGLSLAIELRADLVLAHIVPYSVPLAYAYPEETHTMTAAQVEDIEQRLGELVHRDFRESLNTRSVVKTGNTEDELLDVANDEGADLVVMGTHGRRRFERWLLGSVTEHMLRRATVPMLTVSHLDSEHQITEPRPIPLKKLLYATDLSGAPDRALEMALDLSRGFSAELKVIHVLPKLEWAYGAEYVPLDIEASAAKIRSGATERLEAVLPDAARNDPRVSTELVEGVPYEKILAMAGEGDADIIILNTHGKSGLERALLGSTAERVVRGAHVPVLSVPPAGK